MFNLSEFFIVIFYFFFLKLQFIFVKFFGHFVSSKEKFSLILFYLYLFSWVSVQVFYIACLIEEFLLKYEITSSLPVVEISADLFELPQNFFKKPICKIYSLITNKFCFLSLYNYSFIQIFLTFIFWVFYFKFLGFINSWLTGPARWFFKKKKYLAEFFVFIYEFYSIFFYKNVLYMIKNLSYINFFFFNIIINSNLNFNFYKNKFIILLKYLLIFS